MEDYHELGKNEIKRRYGLSSETFDFYVRVGLIEKTDDKEVYRINKKADTMYLEKNTVFKYCFDDRWITDIRNFSKNIEHSSTVKIYTKEEIAELNRQRSLNKEGNK